MERSGLGFPGGAVIKNTPASAGNVGLIPGSERSSGVGNGNHSSILDGKTPWTEKPSGLQSMEYKELDMIEKLSTAHWTFYTTF